MTLAEKLVAVAKELDAIAKDKEHPHYKYVSAEAFIKAVRGPLMAQGIIIIPSDFKAEWLPQQSPSGKPGVAAHLHAGYTITDGKESIQASVVGEGWDGSGDKASYKAMTGAHKYLLRILFNIPMVDDPEASGGGYGRSQAPPAGSEQPRGQSRGKLNFEMTDAPHYKSGKHVFASGPKREMWDGWTWKQMALMHEAQLNAGNATIEADPITNMLSEGQAQYITGWNLEQAQEIDRMAKFKVENEPANSQPPDDDMNLQECPF